MNDLSSEQTTDECLAIRCQLGDEDSWRELVQRWNPKLLQFLCRMTNDQTTAEDLSQVIWLKIVRSMSKLNDPASLAPWIYRIARIAVTDRLREQYRSPNTVHDETEQGMDDSAMQQFVESDLLAVALRRIHAQEREVLVLHYFEHLSVAEIADVCSVPIGTVKSRMSRARNSLRNVLESGETSQ